MAPANFYVTTPIYYVNGLPHIGHGYTTTAADALTRFHRMLGDHSFFLTGTDEHGQKVMEKAKERGMTPIAHCDDMVQHWKAMWEKIQVKADRFIRTTEEQHIAVVQATLQKLWNDGLIERRNYEGWYSISDEIFVTDKDVEEGKYDKTKLVRIQEANYFFLMSRFQEQLVKHIDDNPSYIQPDNRKNEVKGFLRRPLQDLCISRPKARMSWGIEIPFDTDYVTYVWFDALLNYLSGIGWHPDAGQAKPGWEGLWSESLHLLGKDILTTHAVYWSTMLMGLNIPLPKQMIAHGWWVSSDGQKMSKSLGNTIDVGLVADEFGVDALRYFFLREIQFGADGGFSYEGFMTRYNADLANDLGNLAHRGLSMTTNWLDAKVPDGEPDSVLDRDLMDAAGQAVQKFISGFKRVDFKGALEGVNQLVAAGNLYVDRQEPWTLNKKGEVARLRVVKRNVLEACFIAAALMLPVIPNKATELLAKLGQTEADAAKFVRSHAERLSTGDLSVSFRNLHTGAQVTLGDPLFPRFRELPPRIAALMIPEPPVSETPEVSDLIEYDDFAKVKLRTGKIVAAERIPKADKLLQLSVDVGEAEPRTILAGIATKFAPEDIVGRTVVVVVNLKPRKMRGIESNGMLLAAGGENLIDLVSVNAGPGEIVR